MSTLTYLQHAFSDLIAQGAFGIESESCKYVTRQGTHCVAALLFKRISPTTDLNRLAGDSTDALNTNPTLYADFRSTLGLTDETYHAATSALRYAQRIHDFAADSEPCMREALMQGMVKTMDCHLVTLVEPTQWEALTLAMRACQLAIATPRATPQPQPQENPNA